MIEIWVAPAINSRATIKKIGQFILKQNIPDYAWKFLRRFLNYRL